MAAPIFVPIDSTAFDDDTQLSTAHLKLLAEDVLFVGNERLNIAAVTYSQRSYAQSSARRMPQYASAQWVGRGPFRVWCPPIRASSVTAGRGTPLVYLRIVGAVTVEAVEVYATGNTVPAIDNAALASTLLNVGAINEAIPLYGMRAGWNDVYLWIRSVADTSAPSTLECTRAGFTDPEGWNDERYQETFGTVPTVNPPLRWAAVGYPSAPVDKRSFATIGYSDTVSAIVLAEPVPRANWNGTQAGDTTLDVTFGPLGVLSVFGLFVDETQEMDCLDEGQWSGLRWYQVPSALFVGLIAGQAMQSHTVRQPQLAMGNAEVFDVQSGASSNIGGHWKITVGGWAAYTEQARFAVWSRMEALTGRKISLEVCVPVMLASGYPTEAEFTLGIKATIYDVDGTTILTTEVVESVIQPFSPIQSRTARWAILANGVEDSGGRRFGFDGFTAPEDVSSPVWTWASLVVDFRDVTTGDLAFVAVSAIGETSTAFGHVVIGDIAIRTTQSM